MLFVNASASLGDESYNSVTPLQVRRVAELLLVTVFIRIWNVLENPFNKQFCILYFGIMYTYGDDNHRVALNEELIYSE
jgi:hypothetical protein